MSDLFDLIIIGAGINGAGIARDAAMRGLKVLLMDQGDICSGTSSVSTRLIHGGLRYLEHGEVGLVRESLRERETLLRIAPHLVRPLPILIPIYANRRRGLWTVRAGMIAYDVLSFDKSLPRHQSLSPVETLRLAPGINSAGLRGASIYYDAQVEFAERLVLENVISARDHGASVKTYSHVDEFIVEEGAVCGVRFGNKLSRQHEEARAQVVINAAGPWVDRVLAKADVPAPRLIGGTKGSHLIVAPFSGAPENAIYVEAERDGRPFFVIPWNGNYLIGTTDIRFEGDPERVEINAEETDYLLSETNRLIPDARLNIESILFTYSGIRPLAFTHDQDEQRITRRHFLSEHPQLKGLISVVGGKLTTYRSLAQRAVDSAVQRLGKKPGECQTAETLLPGAETTDLAAFAERCRHSCGLSRQTATHLLRVYGSRAAQLLELLSEETALGEVIDGETGAIAAEVVFAFREEMAQTLADCLLRRTMVGLDSTAGLGAVEFAAAIAQKHLGWSTERVQAEIESYHRSVERVPFPAVSPESTSTNH